MCRWLVYTGGPIRLEDMLFRPTHNIIDQSLSSRSPDTPTNGDGFGVGWYGDLERPGLFHSIRPAWNDFNLRDLAEQIQSRLFMAHVRATSLATVQETNCHPFRYGNWLFVHNGEIFEFEKIHQQMLKAIAPEYFQNIYGTTDSEIMFHLALTFGLMEDPLAGLARMVGFIEKMSRERGVNEPVWMTVGVSDGHRIYAVRYATDKDAPTLFISPDVEHVYSINPAIKGKFGPAARAIVSEPQGDYPHVWKPIPQNSSVIIETDSKYVIRDFQPVT
jgi:glutamine amidotransferase